MYVVLMTPTQGVGDNYPHFMTHHQDIIKRLKTIEGHLRKVREMVEEDAYCVDVIHQSSAVQQALRKVDELVLEHHLRTCVVKHMKAGETDRATREILSVFHRQPR